MVAMCVLHRWTVPLTFASPLILQCISQSQETECSCWKGIKYISINYCCVTTTLEKRKPRGVELLIPWRKWPMAETPPIKNVIYFTMQTYHQLRIACLIWVWSVRIFWWNLNRRQSFIWTYYTQVHSRIYPSLGPHGLTICLNVHVQYDYAHGKDKCVSLRLLLTTKKRFKNDIFQQHLLCDCIYR